MELPNVGLSALFLKLYITTLSVSTTTGMGPLFPPTASPSLRGPVLSDMGQLSQSVVNTATMPLLDAGAAVSTPGVAVIVRSCHNEGSDGSFTKRLLPISNRARPSTADIQQDEKDHLNDCEESSDQQNVKNQRTDVLRVSVGLFS